MPYLHIRTSAQAPAPAGELLARASKLVAEQLGKPEHYVMVSLEQGQPLLFGGSDAPAAYLELKSIGLPGDRATALSEALCGFIEAEFGIGRDRTYIEFADAQRHLWGWNGGTF